LTNPNPALIIKNLSSSWQLGRNHRAPNGEGLWLSPEIYSKKESFRVLKKWGARLG
jgi:hypothetical protein